MPREIFPAIKLNSDGPHITDERTMTDIVGPGSLQRDCLSAIRLRGRPRSWGRPGYLVAGSDIARCSTVCCRRHSLVHQRRDHAVCHSQVS